MERISDSLRGSVRLKIFGAFPASVLNTAAADGIELWNVESKDENTLCLSAYEGRFERLCRAGGVTTRPREINGAEAGFTPKSRGISPKN